VKGSPFKKPSQQVNASQKSGINKCGCHVKTGKMNNEYGDNAPTWSNAASTLEKKVWLDRIVTLVNTPAFISDDPISLPRRMTNPLDREIIAFWVAMLSWGQRTTIINKGLELITFMEHQPHAFIVGHSENDLRQICAFKHRTFQTDDTLYFIRTLHRLYNTHQSMGHWFTDAYRRQGHIEGVLCDWHTWFFDDAHAPARTRKHVATPATGSACKRLNMFLRWMVRPNTSGVDFGLWPAIPPSALLIPLDVHVGRVARQLGLLNRSQNDWRAVIELTGQMRQFDPGDPVKYDFALFGLGAGLIHDSGNELPGSFKGA
jgi:uncharacterized protein (TIGR02757 family)